MVTEDYVSFETAKLLKEKGFESDECIAIYDLGGNNEFIRNGGIFDNGPEDYLEFQWGEEWRRFGYYLAPTLQMAMKWLRKVYRLEIYPFHDMFQGNAWWYRIERNTGLSLIVEKEEDPIYGTYEQACEEAIKYCLENLI